jgi:hypothetical protein
VGNHPAAQHQSFDAAEVGHRIPLLRDTSMRRFSRGGKALRAAEGGVSSAALTRCVEAGRACEKRGGMKGEEARYLEIAGRRVFHCRFVVRLDHVLQRSAASTPRHVSNSVQSDRRGLDMPVCPWLAARILPMGTRVLPGVEHLARWRAMLKRSRSSSWIRFCTKTLA